MGKLWGGRFSSEFMDPGVLEFTSSLDVDKVLAKYDCFSTAVHVEMLARCGYLSPAEKKQLSETLEGLGSLIEEGKFLPTGEEDIHSAIQSYVASKAPEASKKMHTGRSRNEQVVNDVRMYCKEKIDVLRSLIKSVQRAFIETAENNGEAVIPGYTHLNRAQPVLFAHLLLAYVEMLDRDAGRLKDAGTRLDMSVMGSGAIAGSALKLDRSFTAERSGFSRISSNSIDAVSDRDFMVEILSALSLIAVHLSRISEDLILFSTAEFGFIDMGEAYCTGSSLMPQKKNPDVLELIRGRSSGVIGDLNSALVLLKGTPHSYNRDLQEDKKYLFGSVELISRSLAMMAGLGLTLKVRTGPAEKALEDEFLYATDIAEYLVSKGVAFSDAHRIVGNMVSYCSGKGINISDLSMTDLKGFSPELDDDLFALLDPAASVSGKKTPGGTNPDMVKKEISLWKKRLK